MENPENAYQIDRSFYVIGMSYWITMNSDKCFRLQSHQPFFITIFHSTRICKVFQVNLDTYIFISFAVQYNSNIYSVFCL